MARKKAEPKPLFAVKHDFVESLDEFIQRAINLNSMVEMALAGGHLQDPLLSRLREAHEAFERAALTRDDD